MSPEIPFLAGLLSPIQSIVTPFADRTGAVDAVQSALFFALNPELLSHGVSFRERDFSYFAVEEWAPLLREYFRMEYAVKCVGFEGEIPCLYSLCQANGQPRETPVNTRVFLAFLGLVDFVAKRTGSGLAIFLAAAPTSQTATDLRTGRRVRYLVRRLPDQDDSGDGSGYYWFERTESGLSGSYATVMEG